MLRLGLSAFVVALFLASAAAQVVSYDYDGVYIGSADPAPGLSGPNCAPLPLNRIEIRNGALRAYDNYKRQSVKGIVTPSGFFNADYYFPGRQGVVFEGRIDGGGGLSGGIMDGGCAWVVSMLRL
ncbi:MAG: hypothetical protein R3C58_09085 [Parvularculaceae bacterium]